MSRVYISRGTLFMLNGRTFEVKDEIKKDVFSVKDLEFNVEKEFALTELLHHLETGNLQFNVKGKNTNLDTISTYKFDDFSLIPERHREQAVFRYKVIKPLLCIETNSLSPYIDARVEQLRDEGHSVSRHSIYRWIKAYRNSEEDIRSLVSNYHKSGPPDKRLQKEVEMIIDRIIDNFYLKREAITIKTVYELIYHEIDKENDNRIYEQKLLHPSNSTIRRRILERDGFEVDKGRNGLQAALRKHKQVQLQEKPKYPLQRVEMDHTPLDLIVLDDETLIEIGRPTVTSILDIYTGYPLGVYIGFEPASYTSVMQALLHAITPKNYVKDKYPSINNEWLAYGLPEILVVDNGKEFHSKHLKEACDQLGIEIVYCPPGKPWYKGAIERHFRTINEQLIHQTPGTTFSNVQKKGDYNSKKSARIRFNKLLEIFHTWLIDYYANSENGGVKGVPAVIWKKAYEHLPSPPVPSSKLDWKIALMKMEYGSIQKTGIRRAHLFYQGPELRSIKGKLYAKGKENRVKYKYDPTDLSRIYVYDEFEKKYFEILCTDQKYTEGLNEYAHRVILKHAKDEIDTVVDKSALAAAKAKIIQMISDESQATMKELKKFKRIEGKGSDKEVSTEPPKPSLKVVEAAPIRIKEKQKKEKESELFDLDMENDWGYYDAN
jgi:putative transposase